MSNVFLQQHLWLQSAYLDFCMTSVAEVLVCLIAVWNEIKSFGLDMWMPWDLITREAALFPSVMLLLWKLAEMTKQVPFPQMGSLLDVCHLPTEFCNLPGELQSLSFLRALQRRMAGCWLHWASDQEPHLESSFWGS